MLPYIYTYLGTAFTYVRAVLRHFSFLFFLVGRYLVDKVNGVAYTNNPASPKHVGTWNGAGIQLDQSKATAVKRMEHRGETYLVDQVSGLVYTNDLQNPNEVGMWSMANGITLFRAPEKKKKPKPAAGRSEMSEEEKRFMSGNAALPDRANVSASLGEARAIKAAVVYDDVPGSMGQEGNYQGMSPDWIDGQHKMLANFGWFRDLRECKNDEAAVEELEDSDAGHFVVRVVEGKELALLPSRAHKGRPGNYTISVCMPELESKVGIDAVYHFLVLPSWDPTGRSAGETLYRIGVESRKLFTSIPEMIRYYASGNAFHQHSVPGKKKKKKYKLVNPYPDPENYADLVVDSAAGYLDVGDQRPTMYQDVSGAGQQQAGAYQDVVPGAAQSAYMDVNAKPGGGDGGGAAYMTVGTGGGAQAAYMTVDTGADAAATAYQDVTPASNAIQEEEEEEEEEEDYDDDEDSVEEC